LQIGSGHVQFFELFFYSKDSTKDCFYFFLRDVKGEDLGIMALLFDGERAPSMKDSLGLLLKLPLSGFLERTGRLLSDFIFARVVKLRPPLTSLSSSMLSGIRSFCFWK
jgi:hypothetical protein